MTDGVTLLAGAADADDFARTLRAFNAEFDEPAPDQRWLAGRVAELLGLGATAVVLIRAGSEIDGLALMRFRPSLWEPADECYLAELYVRPPLRGRGLGRQRSWRRCGTPTSAERPTWTSPAPIRMWPRRSMRASASTGTNGAAPPHSRITSSATCPSWSSRPTPAQVLKPNRLISPDSRVNRQVGKARGAMVRGRHRESRALPGGM